MQGQRQVAQLSGEGGEGRVALGQVGAVLPQQGDALRATEHAEGQRRNAQTPTPAPSPAGDQHAAAARLRPPLLDERLGLAG